MKELGNTPANICTPTYLGNTAKELGRKYKNLSVKVLGEKEMEKLGMHCLLSVGNGSVQESKFIIIEYKGGKKTEQPKMVAALRAPIRRHHPAAAVQSGRDKANLSWCIPC